MAAKVAASLPFRHDVRGGALRPHGSWRSLSGAMAGLCWNSGAAGRLAAQARGKNRSGRPAREELVEEEEEEVVVEIVSMDDDGEEELVDDDLSYFRGLVLDLSYRPVNVVCWKRAICLEFMEKLCRLMCWSIMIRQSLHPVDPSTSLQFLGFRSCCRLLREEELSRVLAVKTFFTGTHSLVNSEDRRCQERFSSHNFRTSMAALCVIDQQWAWEKLTGDCFHLQVAACSRCNSRKGQKTLEQANMKLLKIPKAPKEYDIVAVPLTRSAFRMLKRRQGLPDEWLQYLTMPSP